MLVFHGKYFKSQLRIHCLLIACSFQNTSPFYVYIVSHCQCYGLTWESSHHKNQRRHLITLDIRPEMFFVPPIQQGFFIGLSAFQELHLCERLCHKKCMQQLCSRNVNSKQQSAIATVPESIFVRKWGFFSFHARRFLNCSEKRASTRYFSLSFSSNCSRLSVLNIAGFMHLKSPLGLDSKALSWPLYS